MVKPDRSITITISPELYADLKTVAFVRYMNGSANESLGDAFLCKLFYLLDKGVESHHFKYKKEGGDEAREGVQKDGKSKSNGQP